MLRMPIHDKVGVGGQNQLIELGIHDPLPLQTGQAVANILAGLCERCLFYEAFVIVDIDGRMGDHHRSLYAGPL